jgi:hypothetical protein
METVLQIFKDYGVEGLILVLLVYLILNGEGKFSFRYPRSKPPS